MGDILKIGLVVFSYNRPDHLKNCLNSVLSSSNINLSEITKYIFIDGPKNDLDNINVLKCSNIASEFKLLNNFKVEIRESNIGLAKSIICGVTEVLNENDAVIVIEDDLILSPEFLRFMVEGLNNYHNVNRIGSITGFNEISFGHENYFNTYTNLRHCSWGWGTWKSVWELIDWNVSEEENRLKRWVMRKSFSKAGKDLPNMLSRQLAGLSDSWSIIFDFNCFKLKLWSVAPRINLVSNVGFDGTGTHSLKGDKTYAIEIDKSGNIEWKWVAAKYPSKFVRFHNRKRHSS